MLARAALLVRAKQSVSESRGNQVMNEVIIKQFEQPDEVRVFEKDVSK